MSLKKNTLYSFLTITSRFLTGIVLIFVIAKNFSVSEFGMFAYSFSFGTVILILSNYGYNLYLVREISKKTLSSSECFKNTIGVKLLISLMCIVGIYIYTKVFEIDTSLSLLMWPLSLAFIFNSLNQYIQALFKGDSIFKYEAIVSIAQNLSIFAVILLGIYCFNVGILFVAYTYLFCYFIGAVLSLALFIGKNSKELKQASFSLDRYKEMFAGAFIFAIHVVFMKVYFELDTIIIGNLLGTTEVGYFQVAMRLIVASMIITEIPFNAFYPKLVKELHGSKINFDLSIRLILIISTCAVCLASIIFLFPRFLINTLFGAKYIESINMLRIGSLIILIRFVAGSLGLILSAAGFQSILVAGAIIASVVSVVSNIILVPIYGLMAAILINLFVNFIIFSFYLYNVRLKFKRFLIPRIVFYNYVALILIAPLLNVVFFKNSITGIILSVVFVIILLINILMRKLKYEVMLVVSLLKKPFLKKY